MSPNPPYPPPVVDDKVGVYSRAHRRYLRGVVVRMPMPDSNSYFVKTKFHGVVEATYFELCPGTSPALEVDDEYNQNNPPVLASTIHGLPVESRAKSTKDAVRDLAAMGAPAASFMTPEQVKTDLDARVRGPVVTRSPGRVHVDLIKAEAKAHVRATSCENILATLVDTYDPQTPERMSRALRDLTSGYGDDITSMLVTFPVEGDVGLVAVRDIPFASLCEHHVLPFSGVVSVVYLPGDRVVGLSKIPRLVRAMSRRLQLQERIGTMVADALMAHIGARGAMVVVRGRHSCMALRGAESPGEMVTSCVRGVFADDPAARSEALELIR